jgi:hypothetical protein
MGLPKPVHPTYQLRHQDVVMMGQAHILLALGKYYLRIIAPYEIRIRCIHY